MDNDRTRQRTTVTVNKSISRHGFRKIQEKGIMGVAMPRLSQLYILRSERATLIRSNTSAFGHECTRLVNIVFHSSQVFPSMIGTFGAVCQHLHEALRQKHPRQHFHIIVSEVDRCSFATDDHAHYAEIEQEQYQVLIFSTKLVSGIGVDAHSANNHVQLRWKSVVLRCMSN